MRAPFVAACLALTCLVRVPPALASPFVIHDVAHSVETPFDPPTDLAAMNVEAQRDPMPATCAQTVALDPTTSPTLRLMPSPSSDRSGTPDAADRSDTPDAVGEPASMTVGDGAYLASGLLNCAGATTSAAASVDGEETFGDPYPRLRAVIQTAAIIAGFLLIIWLAYLVAAMTRSRRHARAGRRRY